MSILHQGIDTIIPFSKIVLFPFTLITVILLLFLIIENRKNIFLSLKGIKKEHWIALFLIFFLTSFVKFLLIEPAHGMYTDEALHMLAAKEIVLDQYTGWYDRPLGWPFLLSIMFKIGGIHPFTAIYTTFLFGSLMVFVLFYLSYLLFKNPHISLAAALLFQLFAATIRWSHTAEASVFGLFCTTLALCFMVLYFRQPKKSLFWLCCLAISFAIQTRVESLILLPLILVGTIVFRKENRIKTKGLILPFFVLIALSAPGVLQILHFQLSTDWVESDTYGQIKGDNFSFSNFYINSVSFGQHLFNNTFQPWVFSLLLLVGFFYLAKKSRKECMFLLTWFLCLWFLYFFSWFQTLGGGMGLENKTRFFLSFYPITSIFASVGVFYLSEILKPKVSSSNFFIVSILLVFILFIPYSLESSSIAFSDYQILQTQLPELIERDFEQGCVVVANLPELLKATTHLPVVDTNSFLEGLVDRNNSCLLFSLDYTCLGWHPESKNNCERIIKEYKTKKFKNFSLGQARYELLEVI